LNSRASVHPPIHRTHDYETARNAHKQSCPATALRLQSLRPVGRVAEFGLLAVSSTVKTAAALLGILVVGLVICWAVGFVEFTYPNVIPNEPLLHPQKVRSLDGTNMVLESGEVIALSLGHSSERSAQEISLDISNQISRGGFEVDVAPKRGGQVEIFVRWPRKFRDSAPPFTIPIIPQTVGSKYRKRVAFGAYVGTNSQPDAAPDGSQPIRSQTNHTPAASAPRGSP
jgi:hypothetical protein